MTSLNEIADAAFENSKRHGFWDDEPSRESDYLHYIGNKLMLVVGEVSEAHEELRAGRPLSWHREDGKPEGIASELADIIIRVGDLAGRLGIDLEAIVAEKHAFNLTREHKHGKAF